MYIKRNKDESLVRESLSGMEVSDNNITLSIDEQGFHIETNGRWTGDLDKLTAMLDTLATMARETLEELQND